VYRPQQVLPRIREGLRAFVGGTAFEELSRQWVAEQGRVGRLPFEVRDVGCHWSRRAQVDVVAVNWTDHTILLGEAKWVARKVGRAVVRELVDKAPKVLADLPGEGAGWGVQYAFFARAGFTAAARAEAAAAGALLVDVERMEADLAATETA
jgi:hypothetical protein